MKNAPAFAQGTVAIIWDFDKTLISGYMQDPLFRKYNVDSDVFWDEVRNLETYYSLRGIRVNKDTLYLNHMLTYVKEGVFEDLNNDSLTALGQGLDFYPGLPDFFPRIKQEIENDETFQKFDIKLEHYIVSTGLAAMIRGSSIFSYIDGVWGCEFIEEPAAPGYQLGTPREAFPGRISQIAYAIDNTSKTRALFEINKGANMYPDIDVNSSMREEDRRVPFRNMIYVADGPSDVPVFSILNQSGGLTYAVYPQGDLIAFRQVDALRNSGRIQMFGEADYSAGSQTSMWLVDHARQIAESIVRQREETIRASVSKPPRHLP